jgi:hypothetical protein
LWERARVRGAFQPKVPLTRRVAKTSPTKGEVKSDLCELRGDGRENMHVLFVRHSLIKNLFMHILIIFSKNFITMC